MDVSFTIDKVVGSRIKPIDGLPTFDTAEDAQEWMAEHQAEIACHLETGEVATVRRMPTGKRGLD